MAARSTPRRWALTALVCVLAASGALGLTATGTAAGPRWAPAARATIHPGIVTDTQGGSTRTYGGPSAPLMDTNAFATCP